uniref:uncharacterized protein LOC122583665 n=1 Tax=Erigeron canadensis TaxID=72917 RepID=UPI001CB8B52C|nr:uncharacterized protein LOC122583665 [Erigeron canadensis]
MPEFDHGLTEFLDAAFSKAAIRGQICCPCKRCKNRYWFRRDEVFDHLKGQGFVENYTLWFFHGENAPDNATRDDEANVHDNTDELLHDRFRDTIDEARRVHEGINKDAKTFYRLVEDGNQDLYPGCKNFSKLSCIIRLFLYKTLHGLSNVAFNDLLQLLKEIIPEAKLPPNFTQARKIIRDLGLDYKKIDACPNDCMFYWKESEHDDVCHDCHTSRWKDDDNSDKKTSKVPVKIVWHFPLKPRLQRLFMCSETAKYMTWHDKERPKDGNLRHPADGQSWKDFDSLYPQFAKETRNVRLGLSSDGFNPFRTMSIAHSTWPVVLVNYNLPPWMSMKPEYFMLSLLIPGPESPGNNIDVYLQPLVQELKEIWVDGLDTYDRSKDETFKLYAALTWTISDFPGYSMLSGWKTKVKKTCYMDHRRFLQEKHPWRLNTSAFNGKVEDRFAPKLLSGVEALEKSSSVQNLFGKKRKRKNDSTCPWKKRSIFFELPYWQFNTCRHNLDVMHIEKNICDNLIGTLLDISWKSKDHPKARFVLLELGIKERLHPEFSDDGNHILFQNACFSMSSKEKDIFCRALKEAKLPNGCASDFSRCVRLAERKVSGYKSHDAHILLHYLLQVAVKKSLPKHVVIPLIRLGAFFRNLCKKVIKPEDLDQLQLEITEILCQLEKIFLPAFFDIMVHLPIHLVNEVRLGGPVQYRWMFFMERYLCKLKSYVRNKCRPEGSIAEGYLIEECSTFCSRYMQEGAKTRLNKGVEDVDALDNTNESGVKVFVIEGHPLGGKKRREGKTFTLDARLNEQAHRYALFNSDCDTIEEYIKFHTKARDLRCKTQNSGVSVTALTPSFASTRDKNPVDGNVDYYGRILEIIELDYSSSFSVVLFRCEWYQIEKDEFALTCVNLNKFCCSDDPFVMPNQVHQVFYVPDPIEDGLHYVMNTVPRDFFDFEEEGGENVDESYWCEPSKDRLGSLSQDGEHDAQLLHKDMSPLVVEAETEINEVGEINNQNDDSDNDDDTLWDWMKADEDDES